MNGGKSLDIHHRRYVADKVAPDKAAATLKYYALFCIPCRVYTEFEILLPSPGWSCLADRFFDRPEKGRLGIPKSKPRYISIFHPPNQGFGDILSYSLISSMSMSPLLLMAVSVLLPPLFSSGKLLSPFLIVQVIV